MEINITPHLTPTPSPREQIADWIRQNDLVETAADWLHSMSSRIYAPHAEPVTVSGDDEHVWIGLVP